MHARALLLLVLSGCTPMPELHFNEPPGPPTVEITPAEPTTGDLLTAVVAVDAEDPEGDPVAYTWTWYKDGAYALEGRIVDSSMTTKGEAWRVVGVPDDGEFQGTPAEATVHIGNSPPTVDHASISPVAPTTDDDLVVSATGSDADDDTVEWRSLWSKDGEEQPSFSGELTIPAEATASGETWEVTLTPYDGEDTGEPTTLSAYIDNSIPTITSLVVLPNEPTVADAIGAIVTVDDPDRDSQNLSVEFTWYVDGVEVYSEAASDGSSYLSGEFAKGQDVSVTAVPYDGFAYGDAETSAPLTVVNTPPALDSVSLTPTTAYEGTTLTCTPGTATDADDDRVSYDYAWYVAGTLVSSVTGNTITGANFSKNQDVYCVATPEDDEEPGAPVTSSTVTVQNSLPAITSVSLTPATATVSNTLTANITGGSDADGDSISYAYRWTVNGTAVTATGNQLNPSYFSRDDEVQVTVTPSDSSGSGTAVSSSVLVIDNALPYVNSVNISPSGPRTADDLTCSASGGGDPDSDTVTYTYAWYKNSVAMSATTSSIDDSLTTKGDRFYCTVTPYDGLDYGTPRTAGTVTIANTAPDTVADVLTGLTANECDTLELDASGSTDDDDDTLTYTWSLSSKPTGAQSSTSDISSTTAEQPTFTADLAGNYTFALSANDGSTSATDTVTVTVYDVASNVAPVSVPDADQVIIEQTTGCSSSGSGYVCTPCTGTFTLDAGASYDDDDDPLHYAWSTSSGYASITSATAESTTLTMRSMPTSHLTTVTYQATVTLRVQDCAGNSDTEDLVLTYECTGN